jgi:hypothetical protein
MLLLTFGITLIAGQQIVHAQNCASSVRLDAFTNERIVESDAVTIYGGSILDADHQEYLFSFQLKNDTILVCLDPAGKFMNTVTFRSVVIKLSDNTFINLTNFIEAGTVRLGDLIYDKSYSKIDKATLIKLSTLKITDFRYFVAPPRENASIHNTLTDAAGAHQDSRTPFDSSLSANRAQKVMKIANCMLTYLQ